MSVRDISRTKSGRKEGERGQCRTNSERMLRTWLSLRLRLGDPGPADTRHLLTSSQKGKPTWHNHMSVEQRTRLCALQLIAAHSAHLLTLPVQQQPLTIAPMGKQAGKADY